MLLKGFTLSRPVRFTLLSVDNVIVGRVFRERVPQKSLAFSTPGIAGIAAVFV